jgi:D-alanyl-D-alanine carboxypeptidase
VVTDVVDDHGELGPRLDALLARAVVRTRGVHHGLLAVAATDGSWSWEGAHGEADPDGTPATVRTRYPIASVTKLFTSVSTMLLVERGVLALGDRLVDLLPAEVTRGLHVLEGVDRTGELTIEHLLRHTSGLPDYYEEAPRGQRSPQARLLAGEDAPVPFDEVVRLVRDDLTPHFPPRPADSPHGRARYADTNFQLLGACLERASGQPLRELFGELLLVPLGLDDTASYPERPRSGAVAEPQASVWAGGVVLEPRGALTHQVADGGIVSTLADQIVFLRAVVDGQLFQDVGTWARMHERTDRVFFPVDYGLGVMRYAPPRWMSPAYAIPPLVGHTGSTASWLFHCEQLGIVVAGTFDVARPPLPFRFLPRVLRAVAVARRRASEVGV